jgi:3-hydroxyisobutyrate dehydrogenase-like beta-hydroxyacid dehydrogenase
MKILVLHPGEMGAAVGACLSGRGHEVLWASSGRSRATFDRAAKAGLKDCSTLRGALELADFVVSVCPPHAALDVAREVAEVRLFRGVYVDANAVARDTTRHIGEMIESAGAVFVDGGIIGPPPVSPGTSRLYLSGGSAKTVAGLFTVTHLEPIVLDGEVGAASAIKMCYSAWNKGATALLAGVRALAEHEGIDEALESEWSRSQPEAVRRSTTIPGQTRKAWRWVAEMEEIARSFEAAGLPPEFHFAAAQLYRRLASFKDRADAPQAAEIAAALRRTRSRAG